MISVQINTDFSIRTFFPIRFKNEGDYRSCYIPGFDMYFTCKNDSDEMRRIGTGMIHAFYEFYVKREGHKSFFLKLHSLGFRTENHAITLKRLLSQELTKSKFNSKLDLTPKDFVETQQVELDVAA